MIIGALIFLFGIFVLVAGLKGSGTVSLGEASLEAPIGIVVIIFGIIVAGLGF